VIRSGFWLTTGAVAGIVAYRRVSAIGRRVSASLNPGASLTASTGLTAGTGLKAGTGRKPGTSTRPLFSVRRTRRAAIRAARETYRFTRDVREGMELYTARHSGPAGSTLSTSQDAQRPALEAQHMGQKRHHDEKDGH
jgi:hypothetical protein